MFDPFQIWQIAIGLGMIIAVVIVAVTGWFNTRSSGTEEWRRKIERELGGVRERLVRLETKMDDVASGVKSLNGRH